MKLDEFDTDILLVLIDCEQASTTELAHRLIKPLGTYELRKADSRLRYRVERLRKAKLLTKNGTKYKINAERVSLQEAKLSLAIGVEMAMGMMLVVIPKDGEVMMRQIQLQENNQKNPQ